ncbi:MAG: signal peptidase II [Lentihominibacter sp.]|jgi:signal peptidase II
MIYIIIIVAIMILDRVVKMYIAGSMEVRESIPVIGDFFSITYVQNRGAAFSILEDHTTLLIIVPAIVITIAILFIVIRHKSYKRIFMVALSLICGGGLGNVTDRAAYGYVIDMLDFGSFPVFNVADIAVTVGCGLLLLYMIAFDGKKTQE